MRGDNTHLYPHYDPELAPKFAYGPPKMTRGLLQEIAERQPLSYNVGLEISILEDGMREVHVLGDTVSFAAPSAIADEAVLFLLPALQAAVPPDE